VIYTNADIAPLPFFYTWIHKILLQHPGVHIINRRTIAEPEAPWDQVPLEYYYSELGRPHPGLDCFVFPALWIPRINLNGIVVGRPPLGTALALWLLNLAIVNKKCFVIHENTHLTFHIGDDAPWSRQYQDDEAQRHNTEAYQKTLLAIARTFPDYKTLDYYWERKATNNSDPYSSL
jgi:hypothetical protein